MLPRTVARQRIDAPVFEPDGETDYTKFSHEQLREALVNVDKGRYPLNYQNLVKELSTRRLDALDPGALRSSARDYSTPTSVSPDPSSRKAAVRSLYLTLGGFLLLAFIGSDTTISMNPLFGIVIPTIIAAGFFFVFSWFLFRQPERTDVFRTRWKIESRPDRVAILFLCGLCCTGMIAYCVRDGLKTLGVAMGGTAKSLEATVREVRLSSSSKNRCLEYATFELQDLQPAEICVRHRYRADLIGSELRNGERVTLIVQGNWVGKAVVRIGRGVPLGWKKTRDGS